MSGERRPLFIDTTFLVAAFNPHDGLHARAIACAPLAKGRRQVTTDFVLMEFANAFAGSGENLRRIAAGEIARFRVDPNIEVIPASRSLFDKALDVYTKYEDKNWGLVDCTSFVVMSEKGITGALTHDYHFVQMGFTALMREV